MRGRDEDTRAMPQRGQAVPIHLFKLLLRQIEQGHVILSISHPLILSKEGVVLKHSDILRKGASIFIF